MLVQTLYICYVWLPSSLLPASLQHPLSFQPPYSILTASSQHHYSLNHQSFLIHRCIDHLSVFAYICIVNKSCVIYIYVHSPSIFCDNIHALVINLYGWFVTHTLIQCFFVLLAQNSCWCNVSWHQGCLPSVHCTTHAHYAISQTCICWTAYV